MIYATPNYVAIGSSAQQLPEMVTEVCDLCSRTVWIEPRVAVMLREAEVRDDRSVVLCVPHAMREYGQRIVVQILLAQREGDA